MNKNCLENNATLESSPWQRFLSAYLENSIRITANLSTLFFLSVIEVYFLRNPSNNFIVRLIYLISCAAYGFFIAIIARKIVSKYYKPNFSCKSLKETQIEPNGLVLSEADYSYRIRVEKLIFEIVICYAVYLATAILVYNFGRLGIKYSNDIAFGLTGGLVSFFNLFGVAMLGATELSKNIFNKIFCLVFGFCFILPQISYIVGAIYFSLVR